MRGRRTYGDHGAAMMAAPKPLTVSPSFSLRDDPDYESSDDEPDDEVEIVAMWKTPSLRSEE
jgi:hypothetical protein